MLGVRRLLPRRKMASCIPAVRGRDLQAVVASYVAIHTGNIGVPVREREVDGRCGVVHGSTQPTVKRVTRVAGLRKLGSHVVRILGLLKITQMAGVACRR